MLKAIRWVKHRLKHKLEHFSLDSLKRTFKEHGVALVLIILIWEVIEDILFPLLFIALGTYVHPIFFAGAPVAWLLCLHWIAVPLLWGLWIKVSNK